MSFTSVKYGSQFKPLKSPLSSYRVGSDLAVPGATAAGLAGLLRQQQPSFQATFPTFTPSSSTPATQPTPPTQPSTRPAAPPPAPSSTYGGVDLSTDPILQQIRALGQQRVQNASSGALSAAEQGLIGYGSAEVPQTLKDLYAADPSSPIYAALNDQGTAAAAKANPDSQLAQLLRAHQANLAGIDNADANTLFYSSKHANDLADEANQYRTAQSQAAQALQAILGQANQGVLDTENQAALDYNNELGNAYNRFLAANPNGLPVDTSTPGSGTTDTGTGTTTQSQGTNLTDLLNPKKVKRTSAAGAGGILSFL